MNIPEIGVTVAKELESTLGQVSPYEAEELIKRIKSAKRIYVTGAGRSLLMLKAFAMRLMHIGFSVYVVGEIVTPAIKEGDLLIAGSGSGETAGVALNAKKAKSIGADVALISSEPESTIGKLADVVLRIPATTEKCANHNVSFQPGGNTFEQCLLLLTDSIVISIMESLGSGMSVMERHANLE